MYIEVICPTCGPARVRFEDYDSMIVLERNLALVTFLCPDCGTHLTFMSTLPASVQPRAAAALAQAGADDGRATWPLLLATVIRERPLCGCVRAAHEEALSRARAELEQTATVDDAIARIDAFLEHEE